MGANHFSISRRWLIATGFTLALACPPAFADTPDPWITTKVKMAILTDSAMTAARVNVDTVDGMVTLHGSVPTAAEKAQAEKNARTVTGVREVRNLLAVVSPAESKAVEIADDKLTTDIQNALARDPGLQDKNTNIKVQSVNKGNVVLAGSAATMSEQLRAVEMTRNVRGVKQVASEITGPDRLTDAEIWRDTKKTAKETGSSVKSAASDMWITSEAKVRLMANSETPASSINVDTSNGDVTLFGMVPTADAKRIAEVEVAKVNGVTRVHNELQVVPEQKQQAVADKDDAIQGRVQQRMSDHSGVNVAMSNGVARLTGTVNSQAERMRVLTVTRATSGVRSVVDDLRIESGDAPKQ